MEGSEVWDKTFKATSNTGQLVIYFKLFKVHVHTKELLTNNEIQQTLSTK